jgi:hypothetical protein
MAHWPRKSTVLLVAVGGVTGLLGYTVGMDNLLPFGLVAIGLFYVYMFRQYKK